MRTKLLGWASILAASIAGCASQGGTPGGLAGPSGVPLRRTILVDSLGYAAAPPDRFVLDAEVTHRSKDLEEVRSRVATAGRAVLDAVKPFGLVEQKSYAGSVRLSPETRFQTGEFLGYEMSQQFHFVLDDLSQAEALTEAVLRAGATSVSTEYTHSRRAELVEKARVRAAQDARKRAGTIAEALGMRVGQPVSIKAINEQAGVFAYSVLMAAEAYDAADQPTGEVVADDLTLLPPRVVQVTVHLRTEFELLPQAEHGP